MNRSSGNVTMIFAKKMHHHASCAENASKFGTVGHIDPCVVALECATKVQKASLESCSQSVCCGQVKVPIPSQLEPSLIA